MWKHIVWQIIAIVFITSVFAEDVKESPDEPKTYEFEEIVVTGSRIKSAERSFACASRRPIR